MFDRLIRIALGPHGEKIVVISLIGSVTCWIAGLSGTSEAFGVVAVSVACLNYGYELGRKSR